MMWRPSLQAFIVLVPDIMVSCEGNRKHVLGFTVSGGWTATHELSAA